MNKMYWMELSTLKKFMVANYGKKCMRCGIEHTQKELVVHHRHYRNVGKSKPVEDVVLICKGCHDWLHQELKVLKNPGLDKSCLTESDKAFLDPEMPFPAETISINERVSTSFTGMHIFDPANPG